MLKHSLLYNYVMIGLLSLALWYPNLLSSVGISVLIAGVYGILTARIVQMSLQSYALSRGATRRGVLMVGGFILSIGFLMAYAAWVQSNYAFMGLTWMLVYSGFSVMRAAYTNKLGALKGEILTYLQYVLAALAVVALFGDEIVQSPLGQEALEYEGLGGETLVVLALVVMLAEVVHYYSRWAVKTIEKWIDR